MENMNLKEEAYDSGVDLKEAILKRNPEANVPEILSFRLRQMQDYIKTRQTNKFIDIVMFLHSRYGLQIPIIFVECLTEEDIFDIVSRSYLIGILS